MIFGWDISTSITGVSIFNQDGKYVLSDHIDLRKLDVDMIDKGAATHKWITGLAQKHASVGLDGYDHTHYIEDKLGGFGGGRTMQQTLLKLAGFNAMVSYIIWRAFHELGHGGSVEHIHPSTVKAIMKREGLLIPKGADKKALTLAFVSAKEPTFTVDRNRNDKPQPWCYDRADSYIVARAGVLRKYVSRHAEGTQTPGDPPDAGSRGNHQG